MRRLRWSGGAVFLATSIALQAAAGGTGTTSPAPLFALWEHGPSGSLEAMSPQIAIYQDGTVIARRDRRSAEPRGDADGPTRGYVTRRLPMAELNIWYDDISVVARDEELKGRYSLDQGGAGPAATFYFQAGTHGLLVTVSGLWEGALSPYGALLKPTVEEVPSRLLRIYQDARRLDLGGAVTWKPERIEARFRVPSGEGTSARRWPSTWPKPPLDVVVRPKDATLLLDASEFLAARDFTDVSADWQPVLIDGTVVWVAFRSVLPGEEWWRRHIAADADAARATHAAVARAQLGAERERVRSALQDRVGAPAGPLPMDVQPQPAATVLELPPLDRAEPRFAPLPRTPDPPNPKSKKSR